MNGQRLNNNEMLLQAIAAPSKKNLFSKVGERRKHRFIKLRSKIISEVSRRFSKLDDYWKFILENVNLLS